MKSKTQYFNGIYFTLDEKSGYYKNSTIHKNMHRYVWEFYNGKIPNGYEIHHIDGDKSNNDIANLKCISKEEHNKIHAKSLTQTERNWRRNNLNTKARLKAIEWHKSKEGIEWHKQQAKIRKTPELKSHICIQCGIEFQTPRKMKKFCSGACQQKYRRQHGLNKESRVCCICGKTFSADKYKHTITCSSRCASILAYQNR